MSALAPTDIFPECSSSSATAASRQHRAALWALAVLALAGCAARLLVDEQIGGAPTVAAIMLLSCLAITQAAFGMVTGLLAFLMTPSLFSATPWDSPVRAYVGSATFPVYVFDAVLVLCCLVAIAEALINRATPAARFIRANWITLGLVGTGVLVKVASSGISGEALRNAALFYYFPCVCLTCALIARRLDLKRVLPQVYMRSLAFTSVAPVVVLIGVAVGAGEVVLISSHQGVEPGGILAWLPPGSLMLLSFCVAAFLFNRTTPWLWRAIIVALLAYDAISYWNRAAWLGFACGIGCHWAMIRGWWRGVLPAFVALLALAVIGSNVQDSVREGHNESSEWRLLLWTLAAGEIVAHPIRGHSYGESVLEQVLSVPESQSAVADASIRVDEAARSPHNSYLSLLFFGGLLQGGAVICFIIATLVSLGRAIVRLHRMGLQEPSCDAVFRGAIAVSVYAAFNVVLESPVEGITYWTIIYVAWLWRENALRRLRAANGSSASRTTILPSTDLASPAAH
jgi:O-antigen ligase